MIKIKRNNKEIFNFSEITMEGKEENKIIDNNNSKIDTVEERKKLKKYKLM